MMNMNEATTDNGYGAHGMGSDNLEIGDNTLQHWQNGGSTWRWSSG